MLPIRDESLARNISRVTDVNETKQLMSAWGRHTEKRGGGELTAEGRCVSCDPPLLVESINVALLFSLNTQAFITRLICVAYSNLICWSMWSSVRRMRPPSSLLV